MRKYILITVLLCLGQILLCAEKETEIRKNGYIEEKVYINDFFKFSMNTGNDWVIHEDNMKNSELEKQKTFYLFVISKNKLETSTAFNPSIIGVAEKIGSSDGVNNGVSYLSKVKNILTGTNTGYKIVGVIQLKEINGIALAQMRANIKSGNFNVSQEYYSAVIKGYAVSFILSYTTQGEKEYLEKRLNSIKKIK